MASDRIGNKAAELVAVPPYDVLEFIELKTSNIWTLSILTFESFKQFLITVASLLTAWKIFKNSLLSNGSLRKSLGFIFKQSIRKILSLNPICIKDNFGM